MEELLCIYFIICTVCTRLTEMIRWLSYCKSIINWPSWTTVFKTIRTLSQCK